MPCARFGAGILRRVATPLHGLGVAFLWRSVFLFTGIHTGYSLGPPPSQNPVSVTALCLARWQDDQVIECFNEFNHLALLQQIGAIKV